MDPRHLAQLATILEKGSITAASRDLHLTQPTLTHNMQVLEQQAGGQLFTRSRLGVRSTPLGEMLAREGRDILRRVQDARAASARHAQGMRSQVRLGLGPLISGALLPDLVRVLQQREPGTTLISRTDAPDALLEQLVDGQHDFVVAPTWQDQPPPGIVRTLLIDDRLGVFCGRPHRLAEAGRLAPGDADDEAWVTHGVASPFDMDVHRLLAAAGVTGARAELVIRGDAVTLLRVLMQGRHLAVLPRAPVRWLMPHFPVVELAVQAAAVPRRIHLWCREALLQDPAFVRVRQCMLDHAATLAV